MTALMFLNLPWMRKDIRYDIILPTFLTFLLVKRMRSWDHYPNKSRNLKWCKYYSPLILIMNQWCFLTNLSNLISSRTDFSLFSSN